MTDTKQEDKPSGTLKLGSSSGGTLKLQLNRTVDTSKLMTTGGGKSGKSVMVEVRKTRTATGAPAKENPASPAPVIDAPAVDVVRGVIQRAVPKDVEPADKTSSVKRVLSDNEQQHRLKVVQNAAKIAEEEAKKQSERREIENRAKDQTRKKAEEEEIRREQKHAEELRKQQEKQQKKKVKDEVDLTEMFAASNKATKKPESKIKVKEYEEELPPLPSAAIEDATTTNTENFIVSRSSAYLDDSDEVEDYSEDVEAPSEEEQILGKSRVDEVQAKKIGIIRPVKGSDKIIIATADREKLKKNLRSEAATASTSKPKNRHEDVRKNTVKSVLSQHAEIAEERAKSIASLRRRREKLKRVTGYSREQDKVYREVIIPEIITVQELAARMTERVSDVIKALVKMGMMVTANQVIESDTAELIATEFGHKVKRVNDSDVENILSSIDDDAADLITRPPVVTVMGHVDHGKTTLLDSLRKTDVAAGEAGGITQHIGAYQVTLPGDKKITFIDTPGHAAFTSMRARGAKVTDIVILVVAADDGIKEQTVEALNHAKAAQVPIVVAVNKIDKPGADSARVKNELLSHDLVAEEFGGDIMVIEVSAKARLNLDKLEEAVLLQAEVLDLKANPARKAKGAVIEAKVDKGRGVVATVLVQNGTLKVGDILVAGGSYGRVRMLVNDKGQSLQSAPPSSAVEVLGLTDVPSAGDEFAVVDNDKEAREIAEYRQKLTRDRTAGASRKDVFDQFMKDGASAGVVKELNVILKGDVHGSVEAVAASLEKVETSEARIRVLHNAVGAITESDVALARASGAIIVGFNVRANNHAKQDAAKDGVEIRYYSIIYELVDEMKKALAGILSPKEVEKFIGYSEIRKVFEVSKLGKIAGCMVTQGIVKRGSKVRLLRDNVVIHEGWLKTLKRFKDDVKEVKEGFECGMAFENYDDIREGDVIEVSEIEKVAAVV